MCIVCALSSMCAGATDEVVDADVGFAIAVNGELTEYASLIRDNTHYLPMRQVFEEVGAYVFYRSRDHRILILSRDGDMIQHVVGTSSITVNGETKNFPNPSVSENNVTYLPVDMMTAAFRSNAISFADGQINISKPVYSKTEYGKAVNDALYATNYSNFLPEKFKRYINYHIKRPELSMPDVVYTVNLGLDAPFYENVTVISNPYDRMVLVNKYNQLPYDFKQTNLVTMDRKYTAGAKQYLLGKEAYDSFTRMADAARSEGVTLRVISAYRTESYQRNLYNKKVRATGQTNADNYSAKPGFSEHQTGLAVDINSTNASFDKTGAYKWLENHAHEYGYILRYPKGGKWITGYEYEPWHYRYVGVEAAKTIKAEDITYEQYYAKYVAVNEFK